MITLQNIYDMERTCNQIKQQMMDIDAQLSKLHRSQKKPLIEQKRLLLINLNEEKLRLKEARTALNCHASETHPITDHALMRWLERKHKLDIKRLKDLVLNESLKEAINTKVGYWSDGDVVFIIKDGLAITVVAVNEVRAS